DPGGHRRRGTVDQQGPGAGGSGPGEAPGEPSRAGPRTRAGAGEAAMIEIDVRDLVGHPGSSRTVRVDEPVEGLEVGLAAVPADAPIEGELLLESVVEGIFVTGPLHGSMRMSCARCLKSFEQRFDLEVGELFAAEVVAEGDEYPLGPEGAI